MEQLSLRYEYVRTNPATVLSAEYKSHALTILNAANLTKKSPTTNLQPVSLLQTRRFSAGFWLYTSKAYFDHLRRNSPAGYSPSYAENAASRSIGDRRRCVDNYSPLNAESAYTACVACGRRNTVQ